MLKKIWPLFEQAFLSINNAYFFSNFRWNASNFQQDQHKAVQGLRTDRGLDRPQLRHEQRTSLQIKCRMVEKASNRWQYVTFYFFVNAAETAKFIQDKWTIIRAS